MKICKFAKCGIKFHPIKINQDFCCPEHRHAHNNWMKTTGIHLCPRALCYVQSLAEVRKITNDEMANEMILKMANPDGLPLTQEEATGVKGASQYD